MAMDESTATEATGTAEQDDTTAAGMDAAAGAESAAATVTYPVAPGYRVNVRRGPSTSSLLVKTLAYDVRVQIRCQRRGERVTGPYGTTDIWDNIGPGQYVSDAYVKTGSSGFVTVRCNS